MQLLEVAQLLKLVTSISHYCMALQGQPSEGSADMSVGQEGPRAVEQLDVPVGPVSPSDIPTGVHSCPGGGH